MTHDQREKAIRLELDHVLERQRLLIEELHRLDRGKIDTMSVTTHPLHLKQ